MLIKHIKLITLSAQKGYCLAHQLARRQFASSSSKIKKKVTDMKDTTKILANLRALMKKLPNDQGAISAYIIPTEDAHQSEYIDQHDERRTFLTGFDGSAGTAVVTANEALLWTDGRYYLQATKQMDSNWTLMKDLLADTPSIDVWLSKNLKRGDVVGVDANLLRTRTWNIFSSTLDRSEITLKAIDENLVDLIWPKQPKSRSNPIITLSPKITGKTIQQKTTEIRKEMIENGVDVLVVTALDEIAWFLNLRGTDIDYNPVFFAYVIVTTKDIHFFVDSSKLPSNYAKHCKENGADIIVEKYENIKSVLKDLATKSVGKVWIGFDSAYALTAVIPERKRHQVICCIAVMKAIKNETEAAGMKNCHIRDGVALCKYFAWLEKAIGSGEHVTEITGADKLEEFRKQGDKFMGLSFPSISSSGPNGSIIHYQPSKETDRKITPNEMYLCDSGAQYLDGTTDVTRTWHYGTPTAFHIDCFTRVLKGVINLGTAIFPRKLKGQFLDPLARKALWDVGLDYGHGTGHGIGHFLNVHEGPMGVGFRVMPDDPGLQENMFISNEPGYYQNGEFGIRIEDIVQIVPAKVAADFNGRGALTFETITMCPIETKLIDVNLLNEKERNHLNAYHQLVHDTIAPILVGQKDEFTVEWLKRHTMPI